MVAAKASFELSALRFFRLCPREQIRSGLIRKLRCGHGIPFEKATQTMRRDFSIVLGLVSRRFFHSNFSVFSPALVIKKRRLPAYASLPSRDETHFL